MSRFAQVFKLSSGLYAEECPVVIEAGALVKDADNNQILAQLKLRNISENTITSCKVAVRAFEPNGNETEGVSSFYYLDIQIAPGGEFGSKVPIYLPNNTTRDFLPSVIEVVFEDGTVWSDQNHDWKEIPIHQRIESILTDSELRKQYGIEVNGNCANVPELRDGLFLCACGAVNLPDSKTCYQCRRDSDFLISALNVDALSKKKDVRLQKEAEQREAARIAEEERQKEEERIREEQKEKLKEQQLHQQELAKKRKKKILFASIITAMIIPIPVLIVTVFIPSSQYHKAVSFMEQEDYESAVALLETLDDYKDSAELLTQAHQNIKYQEAAQFMEDEKYDAAIPLFEELNGYKDSTALLSEAKYNLAVDLLENGNYDEAMIAFEDLDTYQDSEQLLTQAQQAKAEFEEKEEPYVMALQLYQDGDYTEAAKKFKRLGEYKDSAEMMKKSSYAAGTEYYNNQKYLDAAQWFQDSDDYEDSSELHRKSVLNLMEQGKYQLAATAVGYSGFSEFLRENGYTELLSQFEADFEACAGTYLPQNTDYSVVIMIDKDNWTYCFNHWLYSFTYHFSAGQELKGIGYTLDSSRSRITKNVRGETWTWTKQ